VNIFKVAVAVIAVALAAGCGIGTNPANAPRADGKPGPVPDAVQTEIKGLEQVEAKAFLERDVPTLSKLWDAKIVVNNPDNKIVADVSPEKRPGLKKPRTVHARGRTPHRSGKPCQLDGYRDYRSRRWRAPACKRISRRSLAPNQEGLLAVAAPVHH
jgi:hypothetical protein